MQNYRELRCKYCGRLLAKGSGSVQIKMYALQKYQYLQLIKNHQNATEHQNIMIHYIDKSTASTRYIGVTHGLYQTTTHRPMDGR